MVFFEDKADALSLGPVADAAVQTDTADGHLGSVSEAAECDEGVSADSQNQGPNEYSESSLLRELYCGAAFGEQQDEQDTNGRSDTNVGTDLGSHSWIESNGGTGSNPFGEAHAAPAVEERQEGKATNGRPDAKPLPSSSP